LRGATSSHQSTRPATNKGEQHSATISHFGCSHRGRILSESHEDTARLVHSRGHVARSEQGLQKSREEKRSTRRISGMLSRKEIQQHTVSQSARHAAHMVGRLCCASTTVTDHPETTNRTSSVDQAREVGESCHHRDATEDAIETVSPCISPYTLPLVPGVDSSKNYLKNSQIPQFRPLEREGNFAPSDRPTSGRERRLSPPSPIYPRAPSIFNR